MLLVLLVLVVLVVLVILVVLVVLVVLAVVVVFKGLEFEFGHGVLLFWASRSCSGNSLLQ